MGVFYYIRAVALLEDLPIEEHKEGQFNIEEFVAQVEAGYTLVSQGSNYFGNHDPITRFLPVKNSW